MNDLDLKVVLLGQSAVGKTCIVGQFVMGKFDPAFCPTLGASYASKTIVINNQSIALQIWDTAGQERFRVLAPMYYHGAQAAILVFSVTNEESFREIDFWVQSIKENVKSIELFLVGNKIDLENERKITEEQGRLKAEEINALYFETSAKMASGVDELFMTLCKQVCNSKVDDPPPQAVPLEEGVTKKSNKCAC